MTKHSKQQGITLIGFIMVLTIIGFFAYIGIRVGPVYSEYYSVKTAMDRVADTPGVGNMTPAAVKKLLEKNFFSSYVERVKATQAKVTRSRGKRLMIKYDVQEPLMGNMELLMHFEYSVDLK